MTTPRHAYASEEHSGRRCWGFGVAFLLSLLWLHGFSPVAAPADAEDPAPPASPLDPEAASKLFQVDSGLRIELVASEPDVVDPVEIAFDEGGRLWVVEMGDYPNGPPDSGAPRGRIKILEDRDGDGVYGSPTTFAEGLLFANGLMPWGDGVIVTASPSIEWLRDTDGDDRMDTREVLYRGFTVENPQLRVSHPTLGLDNWIYVANGLRGGEVIPAELPDTAPIDLGGRDFRFDPLQRRGEAISGPGQFGLTFDAWGRRFVCDNRHHLRHVVFPERYARDNPHLAVTTTVEDVSILGEGLGGAGGKLHPISRNWTTSSLHTGHFTAACGVVINEGDALPEPYRGAAFTCDPAGNLVHMETLEPRGATFRSQPAHEGIEFLASTDSWFRPVNLTVGPDGALYIVDMYRAVIEHPQFMPDELKNRPDLYEGNDRGRIWRVVPEDHHAYPVQSLDEATVSELIQNLGHPNVWRRLTAQRLLRQKHATMARAELLKLLDRAANPLAKLQAARLLDCDAALSTARLLELLADSHPRVREHAVQMTEPRLASSVALHSAVIKLTCDNDAAVRFQVALSLGTWDSDEIIGPLVQIALSAPDDRWMRLAVASAVHDRAAAVLFGILDEFQHSPEHAPGRYELVQELSALLGAKHDPASVAKWFRAIDSFQATDALRLQMASLDGLIQGLERSRQTVGPFLDRLPGIEPDRPPSSEVARRLLEVCVGAATDELTPLETRLSAIKLLAYIESDQALPILKELITADPSPEIRTRAVRALGGHERAEVTSIMLDGWGSYSPTVRRAVADELLQEPARVRTLLEAVARGDVRPGDFDATHTRRMVEHPDPGIRSLAGELLQRPGDRREAIERYQSAVTSSGDPTRGREVFEANCATCHKVADIGVDVGPDIADTRTRTRETLLADILDPNQAIDGNYVGYVVALEDGSVFDGIIDSETASSLTLRQPEGRSQILLRSTIEEIRSTGKSLMPEGLEANISAEQMADLLTFLKDWRYLDGEIPLGQVLNQGSANP